jgi:glycosyltransferase involved in cell wall biosynthesis
MKIVRIIARLNVGGPARHVVWLTAGLEPPEFESLLVAGSVPEGEEDMRYFATDHGVIPFFIPEMSREISLKDGVTVWKLYRLLLRERPDIVHTHTAKAGTVGRVAGFLYRWLTPQALAGRPRRCRFIHTYHGHIFHGYYGRLKTRMFLSIERLLARLVTDRIIVVSEQQRREIHERFGVGRHDQFAVIPLGLDQTLYAGWQARGSSFREEIGVNADELLIGIVGRLTEIKNHDLFLKAASLFKQSREAGSRRVRFLVVGDGGLRPRLEEEVRSQGLTEDVIFAGNRNDPENFYPALDAVALTSRNEGTPLTLIEAMANARPVIATAVGGVVDLLGDAISHDSSLPYVVCRRGISVPPDNASAFAAGLARMVEDRKLRQEIGLSALQYVAQKHSRERLLEDIRALYGELIKNSVDKLQFANGGRRLEGKGIAS